MYSAFGIFQGGGAMGISHIGALKAAEMRRIQFLGVAGASAGSLVAALVAVGYTADQILRPATEIDNILFRNNYAVTDLLGAEEWAAFKAAKKKAKRALVFAYGIGGALSRHFAPSATSLAYNLVRHLGYFSTDRIREAANNLLRTKLLEHYVVLKKDPAVLPRWVRFRDMDPDVVKRCCPLKIIVTNNTTQSFEVFDKSTPDVVVADAVCASISIPLAFKPAFIPAGGDAVDHPRMRYGDGGLSSNLPSWLFVDEKAILERRFPAPIPIYAFRLMPVGEGPDPEPTGRLDRLFALVAARVCKRAFGNPDALTEFGNYCRNVFETGVFGSQDLMFDLIQDLYTVPVNSRLRTLGFDCSWEEAKGAYCDGLKSARSYFVGLTNKRREAESRLNECVQLTIRQLTALGLGEKVRVRACVVEPVGRYSYKVSHSNNMGQDTDDRLVLDLENPGAPRAARLKDVVFLPLEGNDLKMSKYERALVWKDMASLIAIPLFESAGCWDMPAEERQKTGIPVLGVLCIDSNADLWPVYSDLKVLQKLLEQSVSISRTMKGS